MGIGGDYRLANAVVLSFMLLGCGARSELWRGGSGSAGTSTGGGGRASLGDMPRGGMGGVPTSVEPMPDCASNWQLSEPALTSIAAPVDAYSVALEAVDLNGDSAPELVTLYKTFETDAVNVIRFDRVRNSIIQGEASYPDYDANGGDLELGDWNHDGQVDVLVEHGGSATWLAGDGATGLKPGQPIATGRSDSGGQPAGRVRLADLDHDGALDATLLAGNVAKLVTFYGDGSGGTERVTIVPSTGTPFQDFVLVDMNDDGFLDAAGAEFGNIVVYFGSATGFVPEAAPLGDALLGSNISIEVGDIDADGKPDLVLSGAFSPPFELVLLRHRNGYALERIETYEMPQSLAIADVTGDGLADVVVTHGDDDSVDDGRSKLGVYVQCGGRLLPERLFDAPYVTTYSHSGVAIAHLSNRSCVDVVVGDPKHGPVLFHGSGCGP